MKKYLIIAFALLGLTATAMAEDVTTVSVVSTSGDTLQTAELATIDKVEFADSSAYVILKDAKQASDTIKYVRKNVSKLLFNIKQKTDGIQSATVGGSTEKVIIAARGNELSVSGIKAGTAVTVYGMDGRAAISVKASGESVSLDATPLNAGIYIVRAGNKAIKIVKK